MTSARDQDPGSLADKLEHEADQLERRNQELADQVDNVRQDWERKRADEGIPGAVPRTDEDQTSGQGNEGQASEEGNEGQASGQGNDAPPEREVGGAQAEESD
jgi:hypothetical protein